MAQEHIERIAEIVKEKDEPWKDREALALALKDENLGCTYERAGNLLGCSASTIGYWYDKLDVDDPYVRGEQSGDENCIRCETNKTPENPINDMCNECLDYVRAQDSLSGWDKKFSPEVKDCG